MTREDLPRVFHRLPASRLERTIASRHWLSVVGAEWDNSLIERGVQTKNATRNQVAFFVFSSSAYEFTPVPRTTPRAPDRNRTCDLWYRKPTLYPLSYGGALIEVITA